MIMNSKDFLDTVILMRQAQKSYFDTRNVRWLAEAKRLERIVDFTIEKYQHALELIQPKQLDLFD